ncbi:MAG: hypothetical protein DI573_08145 [Microbacterium sp.]|uniref:PilN domain-containing protein n=1 Tax=Microbacterium sp. TaxID=51671 RepID=UPI000DB71C17|nr:hypothetical protein [Microbacterium sp.]PZU39040.1 MAG: hypothetical protein DI573_08145 [Microbacterium sp.]
MGPRLSLRARTSRLSLTRGAATAASAASPRVNLLPRAETERRERAAMIRRWGWGLVGALAAVLVLSGGSYALTLAAEQRLAAAGSRTTDLLAQLATLQDVRQALATETELTAFRAEAMATDLRWEDMLDTLVRTLPPGVTLSGFDLAVGAAPAAGSPESASAPGLSGALTLESPTPIDIAPAVRALRAIPGALSADAREVMAETGEGDARTYTYQLTLVLDQSLYTGVYADPDESAGQ